MWFNTLITSLTLVVLPLSCSMPDIDADKVSLEPDSVSFMETLFARERGQAGSQNGCSPNSDENRSDALGGGGAISKAEEKDKEKASTLQEQSCPVGLHKAVLLYPPTVLSSRRITHSNICNGLNLKMHRKIRP